MGGKVPRLLLQSWLVLGQATLLEEVCRSSFPLRLMNIVPYCTGAAAHLDRGCLLATKVVVGEGQGPSVRLISIGICAGELRYFPRFKQKVHR